MGKIKQALLFINMFCNLSKDPEAVAKWKANKLFLALAADPYHGQRRVGRVIEIVDGNKIHVWSSGKQFKGGFGGKQFRGCSSNYTYIRTTILNYKFFDPSRRDDFKEATTFADERRRLSPN